MRNMILNVFRFHLIPSSGTVRRANRPRLTTGGGAILLLRQHFIQRVCDVSFRLFPGCCRRRLPSERSAKLLKILGRQLVQDSAELILHAGVRDVLSVHDPGFPRLDVPQGRGGQQRVRHARWFRATVSELIPHVVVIAHSVTFMCDFLLV
ncbi:hypothetical protein DSLPV1_015 [Dishui lake phycodnavirus 1]|uniref:hypothetical protein n=1 Tax=Dishui lake phycodnavirus 1 TaxID=2079134 RepID=UPI000CD6832E|nr:hypothetical protein C5Y57_gp015 [Dishui lake phycodnavirus 1]AUT18986.1 hypothetical protein DSLPV1_015 [Dishui lake phycodnavirus 1]